MDPDDPTLKNYRVTISRSGLTPLITTKTYIKISQSMFLVYLSFQSGKNGKTPFVVAGKKSTKKRCNIIGLKEEFETVHKVLCQLIAAFREKHDPTDPHKKDLEEGFALIEKGWEGYKVNYKKYNAAFLKATGSSVSHSKKEKQIAIPSKKESPLNERMSSDQYYVHYQKEEASQDLADIQQGKKVENVTTSKSFFQSSNQEENFSLDMLKSIAEQVLITEESDPSIYTRLPHYRVQSKNSPLEPSSPESTSSNVSFEMAPQEDDSRSKKRKRSNESTSVFETFAKSVKHDYTIPQLSKEIENVKSKRETLEEEAEQLKKKLKQKNEEIENLEFEENFLKKLISLKNKFQ
jgi:hypothetical protein